MGSDLRPGTVLDGRYRLEGLLGEGGMGAVWVARQLTLERDVAVKVVHAAAPEHRPLLRREALALAAVHHPAVIQVFDYGETEDGVPYVVMELLRGESLAARLAREGPLPADAAVEILLPLLDGLAAAHRAGIVHRDVKPANVLLAGDPATPKLLDFGIAQLAAGGAPAVTTGNLRGTPAYMAPEQILGQPLDERVDVWGAGVMLYELVAGALPFDTGEVFSVMRRIVSDPPSFPRHARGLDGRLWSIVMGALRKKPEDRTPSARALREALEAWRSAPPRAPESGTPETPRPAPAAAAPRASDAPTLPAGTAAPAPSSPAADTPSMDALIRAKLRG